MVEILGLCEDYPSPLKEQCLVIREFLKEVLGIPSADLHPALRGLLHHFSLQKKLQGDPTWRYEIRLWTPEEAQAVLTLSGVPSRQEPLVPWRVELYTKQFRLRQWIPEFSPILLDQYGKVLDGRHRLAALAENNKPATLASYTHQPSLL